MNSGSWVTYYSSDIQPKYIAYRIPEINTIFGVVAKDVVTYFCRNKEGTYAYDKILDFSSSPESTAKIFWYSDNTGNYTDISKFADSMLNPPIIIQDDIEIYPQDLVEAQVIMEKNIPCDITGTTEITTDIGLLNNISGKLFVVSTLYSDIGQIASEDFYPFYRANGNIYLQFGTDKKNYKENELVTISGEIKNLSDIDASNLSLVFAEKHNNNTQEFYTTAFDAPSHGNYPFTINRIYESDGVYTLIGKVKNTNNTVLVEIKDTINVIKPQITAELNCPEIVGAKPFDVSLRLTNPANVPVSLNINFAVESFDTTIYEGTTCLINRNFTTTFDTTIRINISGDYDTTIIKTVTYSESGTLMVNANSVYPEGEISIPYIFTNTGLLDVEANCVFEVRRQSSEVRREKTIYIPKGGNYSDKVNFVLGTGNYEIISKAEALPYIMHDVANVPNKIFDSRSVFFDVKKHINMQITDITAGNITNGLIPVAVNIANNGFDDFSGSIHISASFYTEQRECSVLSGNSNTYTFNINPAAVSGGTYPLTVSVLYNGNAITEQIYNLEVIAPTFEFTSIPGSPVYNLSEFVTMNFQVRNTGQRTGMAKVKLEVLDIESGEKEAFISPAGIQNFDFNFSIPNDMEAKSYTAKVYLNGNVLEIPFTIRGIDLSVQANFDKPAYIVGETARLTLNITNNNAGTAPELFAKVNYDTTSIAQNFSLNGNTQLNFNIPIARFTGEKVFYGIYHKDGRSIHLNTIYLYEQKDIINVTTDREVYIPGEIVFVTIETAQDGNLKISGPGGYNYDGDITSGSLTQRFTIPENTQGGTYNISYTFNMTGRMPVLLPPITGTHNFDVNGIKLKIVEFNMNKGKYIPGDTFTAKMIVESNYNKDGILRAWINTPDDEDNSVIESPASFITGQTEVNLTGNIITNKSGIHKLIYSIYDNTAQVMAGGQEAFDVGDINIVGAETDKTDYPDGTEQMKIYTTIYGTGAEGSLEIKLDSTNIISKTVSASGFTIDTTIIESSQINPPGTHQVTSHLSAGSLTSEKIAAFTYGTNLPDLQVASITIGSTNPDNTKQIKAVIVKQRKNQADNILVEIYSGNPEAGGILIGQQTIPELIDDGSTGEAIINWNITGLEGTQTIYVKVDPQNIIKEYDETNNILLQSTKILSAPLLNTPVTITNNDTAISGTSFANASIDIYKNGIKAGNVTASENGEFSYEISLTEGDNVILVIATDSQGNSSVISNSGTITLDTIPPSPPIGITAQPGDKQIDVSWLAQSGDTVGYNIYSEVRSQNPEDRRKINEAIITTTNYMDTGLINYAVYTYWVSAVDRVDNESALSEPVEATPKPSLSLIVNKEINTPLSRVLVYIDGASDFDTTILTNIFNNSNAEYKIVNANEEFLNQFRSHGYNTYVITEDRSQNTEDRILNNHLIQKEFAETINHGDGLILIKTQQNGNKRLFEDLTGTKFKGHSEEKTRTINVGNSSISDTTNIQVISELLKANAKTGTIAAQTDDKKIKKENCRKIALLCDYEFVENVNYFVRVEAENIDYETVNITGGYERTEIDKNTGNNNGNLIIEKISDDEVIFSLNKRVNDLKGNRKFIVTITNGENVTYNQTINITESLEEETKIGNFTVMEIDFEEIENTSQKIFSAIVINTYGRGKTVLITFRPDKVVQKDIITAILTKAVKYVMPEEIEQYALNTVPIHTKIKADNPCRLMITESYDYFLNLLNTNGNSTDHTITWNEQIFDTSIPVELKYALRLPDKSGTYNTETEIKFKTNDTWELWKKEILTLEVTASLKQQIQNILVEINTWQLSNDNDRAQRGKIINKLNRIYSRSQDNQDDLEHNIKDILYCIKQLRKMSIDITPVRHEMDQVLRGYEVLTAADMNSN